MRGQRFRALVGGVLGAALGSVVLGGVVAAAQESTSTTLSPSPGKTIALSRCNAPVLSTPDVECGGFAGTEIRDDPSIFLVGFENNQDLNEKHVLQVILQFDLSQVQVGPDDEVDFAQLTYSEVSTTRRSEAGDSEYGILETCNTRLGVPTVEWDGSADQIVETRPALTSGRTPATTAESGTWDVLPQVQAWMAAGQTTGTLVMSTDDETADIRGQAMCLSYLTDISLTIQTTPKSE